MRKLLLTLFLTAFSLALFGGISAAYSDQVEVTLNKAAVYHNAEVEKGTLAPVMLLSYEGEDYFIAPNENSKQLESMIEKTINVKGLVTVDNKKRKVIKITSFSEAFN